MWNAGPLALGSHEGEMMFATVARLPLSLTVRQRTGCTHPPLPPIKNTEKGWRRYLILFTELHVYSMRQNSQK
jgi:hypothetical protein